MLTSYLPTAFSTLVEPVWLLLNRYYCMLQPFHDLLAAKQRPPWSSPSTSSQQAIKSQYTALPPPLVFYRAFRARHLLLAAVCITALSGNILAIGLGALFNELPKRTTFQISLASRHQTRIADEDIARFAKKISRTYHNYYDPFYVIMANLSYGTALPAWITPDFYFLPLDVHHAAAADDPAGTGLFAGETTGVGVDPGCRVLGTYQSVDVPVEMPIRYPNAQIEAAHRACNTTYMPYATVLDADWGVPAGRVANEFVDTVTSSLEPNVCDETLVLGWARGHDLENGTGTIQTSALACSPTLRMARFRVVFDAGGRVHAATPVSEYTSTWPYENATLKTQSILTLLHYSLREPTAHWHNGTVADDWFNYLIMLQRGGDRATLDPAAPLPDAGVLLPTVEAVYKMIVVAFLSLSPGIFTAAGAETEPATGTQTVEETGLFVSTPACIVSAVILALYLVMVVAYYVWGVWRLFLPRMPSTVGSTLSYVAPSGMVTAVPPPRAHASFGFGRYTGHDGCAQIGVDYADKIVPLDMKRLGDGDTRPRKWSNLRFRKPPTRAETWL